jgi:endosialidase-like protein/trimeric autotransporter adhesin
MTFSMSAFPGRARDYQRPGVHPGDERQSTDRSMTMKTSRILANAVATLAGVVSLGALVPSTAAAQSACYVQGSGTVYRIKEPNTPAQCSPGHVEFQITATTKAASAGGGGGGGQNSTAGGDLSGSYPNPSVVKIQGQSISTNVPVAGQVLTFNGGAWSPAAASLPTNGTGAFNFSNNNGFVSAGAFGNGTLAATGAGVRMLWYPNQAAFRAGQVDGTQWDAASIGWASVAMGKNTIASSMGTVSMGDGTTASGYHSTAIGVGSTASGNYGVAIGAFPTASGLSSLALGSTSTASGQDAVAIGLYAKAPAQSSMALGENTVSSGINSTAMGRYANTSGMTGSFVYGDASTTNVIGAALDNSFVVRAQHFWFGTTSAATAPSGQLIATSTGAYLSTGGTWTNTSDANKKHAFKTVDGDDVLARIDAMPVSTWTYNSESDSVRHMGPTAQDFRKAFGLGDTDKAIATVDADGVSLAAVKALLARTTELRKENSELKAMIADLAQRLAQLEQARR